MYELGPYLLGPNNTPENGIYVGDAEYLLSELPAGCIDLTVTSPPYDNLRTYDGYVFDFEAIARQLYRVTAEGGVVVWVVGDATIDGSETGTSFRQALYFMKLGFNLHDTMIFSRQGQYPDPTRYNADFEYMFVLSKDKPKAVNLIRDKPNKYAGTLICGTDRDLDGTLRPATATRAGRRRRKFGVRSNIWHMPQGKGQSTSDDIAFEHPAVFPEVLARDHILSWSNASDVVLDPMVGSGTTAKMAIETGRRYLGFDISEGYCELARRRIEGAKPMLFAVDALEQVEQSEQLALELEG